MRTQHNSNHRNNNEVNYFNTIPIIDGEFDRFEMNNDLMINLCGTDMDHLHHDVLDEEE